MDKSKGATIKRRIYFIEKEFQTKFILKFLSLVVIGGIATISMVYLFSTRSNTVAFMNSRVVVKTTADFLLPLLIQTVAAVTVVVGLAAIAVTLFVSHKIAGPLYRLKKVMNTLEEGDFSSSFHLRHYDQLQDFADAFDKMIIKTSRNLKSLQDEADLLKAKLGSISDNELSDSGRQKIGELKKISSELDKTLHHFKV